MIGVQLIGIKEVIDRYARIQAASWALFQGRQFIVSGNGAEELEEWLNDFNKTGSTATYTIRMYDSEEPPTAAGANSDYLASVNFKLHDLYEGHGIAGHNNKLMERLDKIEKKMSEPDDEDDDEPETIIDIMMGWLEQPEKLGQVIGAIKQLWQTAPAGVGAMPAPAQAIGSLTPGVNQSQGERLERLSRALDTLERKDPQLVEHLEKLAKLATDSPLTFSAILDKLNGL